MKTARTSPAFQQFLVTPSALSAAPWQLEALAAFAWPPGISPTVETYERMLSALARATRIPDRAAG